MVEVLSQKRKFDNGILVRKVRVTRRVYKKGLSGVNTKSGLQDDNLTPKNYNGVDDEFF